MVYNGPYSIKYIAYTCCRCGATASSFVWRNGNWYCLLCAPDAAEQCMQRTVVQAPLKNRHSSSYVGGKRNRR